MGGSVACMLVLHQGWPPCSTVWQAQAKAKEEASTKASTSTCARASASIGTIGASGDASCDNLHSCSILRLHSSGTHDNRLCPTILWVCPSWRHLSGMQTKS